jgi:D-alanyl-D-alanine carboxypeptidase
MKLKIFINFCILVSFVCAHQLIAQNKTEDLRSILQQKIDSLRSAADIPAMAFSCILPTGEHITVAAGMQPEQRMLAGSTGKTFFAAIALQLVANGKLALDDKAIKYLGENPWYDSVQNATTITIRMLMNHTTGIDEYYPIGDFMKRLRNDPEKNWTPVECIRYTFNRPALFEAGTDWGYADTNYLILGLIIEKITGEKAYAIIQDKLLTPYSLTQTEPSIKRTLKNQVVGVTGPNNPFGISGNVIVDNKMIINPQMEWAGGGFISNTIDLARWGKLYYASAFLSESLRNEMRNGVAAKTGREHQYGLGVQIRPSNLGISYGHGGWFPGYLTEMDYFPDKQIAVAIQLATDDFQKLKRPPRFFEMFLANEVVKNR